MTLLRAELTAPLEVTDMEILGDTLYFCGHLGSNNYVCLLDIPSTFMGSANITVIPVAYSPVDTVGTIIYPGIFTLSKLEVQKGLIGGSGPEFIHIYMIGDVDFGIPDTITNYSCLVDVVYDGSTLLWTINLIREPDRVYYFNDLTITDNYLWVVGNKYEGEGEYMHGYLLPVDAQSVFSYLIIYAGNMQYWWSDDFYYYPITRPLIETLHDDVVAVVCWGLINVTTPRLVISLYNVGFGVSPLVRIHLPNVTATTEFRDLKYNPQSNTLFFMPDFQNSVSTDAVYGFDLTTYTATLYKSIFSKLHSLDYFQANIGAVVSGIIDGNLGEWQLFQHGEVQECIFEDDIPVIMFDADCKSHINPLRLTVLDPRPIEVAPTITEHDIEIVCKDGSKTDKANENNNQ